MAADLTHAELEEIKRKRWQEILSADRDRENKRRFPLSRWEKVWIPAVLAAAILTAGFLLLDGFSFVANGLF